MFTTAASAACPLPSVCQRAMSADRLSACCWTSGTAIGRRPRRTSSHVGRDVVHPSVCAARTLVVTTTGDDAKLSDGWARHVVTWSTQTGASGTHTCGARSSGMICELATVSAPSWARIATATHPPVGSSWPRTCASAVVTVVA